jgi:hypothetical protein
MYTCIQQENTQLWTRSFKFFIHASVDLYVHLVKLLSNCEWPDADPMRSSLEKK